MNRLSLLRTKAAYFYQTGVSFPLSQHLVRASSTVTNSRTKVLYDGDCPLCQKEMAVVKYLHKNKNKLDLIDISKPEFKPSDYGHFTHKELMDIFHVIGTDQKVYKGVEAVHKMYSDIGYGWSTTYLLWPGLRGISNKVYMWFAKNRLRWTGRDGDKVIQKA
ncbi:hypothetical protein HOLleu_05196 [Holothuria leucospilota]|uniref:DUF393 domain-containing protein n=1 Tax=Holothuria leucospilota TaxID=206669 RepID=A0A9Q1CKN7_HOLLE|nr:hypothetical protein HOLleu_05196 [Holothuria leucospilota]